jgi:HlyD family secretion protein/adhesin transport system membrane fusion protein
MSSQSLAPITENAEPAKPVPQAQLPVKIESRQIRHLAQSVQLEETGTSPLIRFTVLLSSLTCFLFIVWSGFTNVTEMAATSGQVIPVGAIKSVQQLEGGIVSHILVHDGQLVDKGQILVKMSPASGVSDLEQTRAREAALLLKAERLRAFAEGRKPDLSIVGRQFSQLVADNQAIYQSQIQAADAADAVIQTQIRQKKSDIALLEQQRQTLQQQVDTLVQEVKIRTDLASQRLITVMQLLDTKRELARVRGQMANTIGQSIVARDALAEAENRLIDQKANTRKLAMHDFSATVAELAQVQQSIGRLADRVSRLDVRSPVRGIVKGLSVENAGAVIQPGGLICQIVPIDRKLEITAKINPSDVGHLKIGQAVKVQVSAFDSERYGSVPGVLSAISASSFVDDKGKPYFKGTIQLNHDYVGNVPGLYRITPGMTVKAEIITGSKSLLSYLLKPVVDQINNSFHER